MTSENGKIDMNAPGPPDDGSKPAAFSVKSEGYGSQAENAAHYWTVPKTGIYKIECRGASNFSTAPMGEILGLPLRLAIGGHVSGLFDLTEVSVILSA